MCGGVLRPQLLGHLQSWAMLGRKVAALSAVLVLIGPRSPFNTTARAPSSYLLDSLHRHYSHSPPRDSFAYPSLKLTFQISDLDNTDPVESVDTEGNVVEDAAPAYITSSLLVTKGSSKKALLFDLGASPDGFEVTNVAIYEKDLAEAGGPEGDWKRRSNYMGPRECSELARLAS